MRFSAKVHENVEHQATTQSLAKVDHETAGVVTPLAEGDSSIDIDSVEMVVSIERRDKYIQKAGYLYR